MKWHSIRNKRRIARQGAERWDEEPPMMRPLARRRPKRPQPSKAEMRAAAEAALAEWRAKGGQTA